MKTRRLFLLLVALLLASMPSYGQGTGNVTMALFPGVPIGTCTARQLALNQSNGALYICQNSIWQAISAGGGGWNPPNAPGDTMFGNNTVSTSAPSFFTPGGDVSFSAGNFSVNALHFGPNALALTNTGIANGNCLQVSGSTLIGAACGTGGGGSGTVTSVGLSQTGSLFTITGSPVTTAGSLNLAFANAPANTMLGNSTASAAAPSWIPIPTGGGGAGLDGCTTPTTGNLVCTGSVQGGTGTVGMLTMPYSSGGLPTPPTDAHAAIAANASGQLFSSTGNNQPFVAIGGGGGGGGNATGITFGTSGSSFTFSNTAPASGDCLQISGLDIVGGPCGTGGGGGMGTVTGFSSGDLSPLFTTSVSDPSTSPTLSFAMSQAPPDTMLGNDTANAGTPTWISIPSPPPPVIPPAEIIVLTTGQNYTLPETAPAGWCVNVIAIAGTGHTINLFSSAGGLNGQTNPINLPLWQMMHLCQAE